MSVESRKIEGAFSSGYWAVESGCGTTIPGRAISATRARPATPAGSRVGYDRLTRTAE